MELSLLAPLKPVCANLIQFVSDNVNWLHFSVQVGE
jgi:hypothetical protein